MSSERKTIEPDIQIEKLSIWIDGRQFPHAEDYDDGNWLNISSEYRGAYSTVKASGPILMTRDIQRFMTECLEMNQTLAGEAGLHSYEINLDVQLKMGKLGQIEVEINITHDHLSEEHKYTVQMDQSYLGEIISQCEKVLKEYPIRGNR